MNLQIVCLVLITRLCMRQSGAFHQVEARGRLPQSPRQTGFPCGQTGFHYNRHLLRRRTCTRPKDTQRTLGLVNFILNLFALLYTEHKSVIILDVYCESAVLSAVCLGPFSPLFSVWL